MDPVNARIDDALAPTRALLEELASDDATARSRALTALAAAFDNLQADARAMRSDAIRTRRSVGESVASIAADLGLTVGRVQQLARDNRVYRGPDADAVDAAARRQAAQERARLSEQTRAARSATREAEQASALAARVAEGRALQARLVAGETRDALIEQTGYSRQRVASLLSEARRAGADETS